MATRILHFGDKWTKTSSSRASWTPPAGLHHSRRAALTLVLLRQSVHVPGRTADLHRPGRAVSGGGRLRRGGHLLHGRSQWRCPGAGRGGCLPIRPTRCSDTPPTSGRGRGCSASTQPSRSCAATCRRFPTRSVCLRSTRCGWL